MAEDKKDTGLVEEVTFGFLVRGVIKVKDEGESREQLHEKADEKLLGECNIANTPGTKVDLWLKGGE